MNLHTLMPVVIVLALVVVLSTLKAMSRPPAPVAKDFLTRREEVFLRALESELPWCRIHGQVAMGALLKVPARLGREVRHTDRNAFSQKIVDFVVQDRDSGRVLALVEIDDRSHNAARDRLRDRMTIGAGYRTIRVPASAKAGVAGIRPVVEEIAAMRRASQPDIGRQRA